MKKTHKKLVIVQFDNGGSFVYRMKSKRPITLERVVKHFEDSEGWNEDRDNIEIINEPLTVINL